MWNILLLMYFNVNISIKRLFDYALSCICVKCLTVYVQMFDRCDEKQREDLQAEVCLTTECLTYAVYTALHCTHLL